MVLEERMRKWSAYTGAIPYVRNNWRSLIYIFKLREGILEGKHPSDQPWGGVIDWYALGLYAHGKCLHVGFSMMGVSLRDIFGLKLSCYTDPISGSTSPYALKYDRYFASRWTQLPQLWEIYLCKYRLCFLKRLCMIARYETGWYGWAIAYVVRQTSRGIGFRRLADNVFESAHRQSKTRSGTRLNKAWCPVMTLRPGLRYLHTPK